MPIGLRVGMGAGISGEAIGINNDRYRTNPMSGVTQDSASLIYCPASSTEWTLTMSAAGLSSFGNPTQLWLLQEGSGTFADSIGTATLSVNGSVSYQSSITGWTRKSVHPAVNGANYLFSTDSHLSDGSTVPVTLLMYVDVITPNAGDGDIALIGDSNGLKAICTSGRLPKLVINGAGTPVTATGASSVGSTVRPWVISSPGGVTPAYNNLYDDLEVVAPASTNCTSSLKQVFLGGVVETVPSVGYLYAVQWAGTGKSMTTSQIRTLLKTLNWSPAF